MQSRGYDGQKADIWSLGVIFYAMLAGNLPFGQDLVTCKRFKHFCKWAKETANKGIVFCTKSDIEFPQWLFPTKFSASTKGLIVAMLYPDPNLRLSVNEAIIHPLCAVTVFDAMNNTPSISAQTLKKPETVIDQLKYQHQLNNTQMKQHISNNASSSSHQSNFQNQAHDGIKSAKNKKTEDVIHYAEEEEMFQMEEEVETATGQSFNNAEMEVDEDDECSNNINKSTRSSENGGLPIFLPTYLDIEKVQDLISTPTTIMNEDEADMDSSFDEGNREHLVPTNSTRVNGSNYPPSFNDMVKRSTRFITAVPAQEVLRTIEAILEDVREHRYETPVGIISKYSINWDEYRLEVWGSDSHGTAICALQLYQIPSTMSTSKVLQHCTSGATMNVSSLILVEFIRGQLEIFAFKRFYQWVRLKLSEIVKGDYAISLFDQSYTSPM